MSRTKDRTYLRNRQTAFNASDTCWICGQWIDDTLPFPDPWSKSADHRTPVARGGHNHGPLAVAHLRCNMSRGVKPPPTRHGRNW
jgi:hypothetical protein